MSLSRALHGGALLAYVALMIGVGSCLAGYAEKADPPEVPIPGMPTATKIRLVYLGKAYDEPVPLSLVDKVLTDNGVQGARLATGDNNKSGRFLGQEFELVEAIVPKNGDVVAKAKEVLVAGDWLVIADLEAPDLLAVASLPEAKDAVILNIRSNEETLREEQCKPNLFHITPDWAMRADALAQYLIWKKWDRWLLLKGTASTDEEYAKAVERAAQRFGGEIVEERSYKFETGNARTDSGHQQIQTQMPAVTQGAPDHDVVWVADTVEGFGEYVSYRTYIPKPVVGTQGLIATAWHRSYEQYAGMQMQNRFERFAKRVMTEQIGRAHV